MNTRVKHLKLLGVVAGIAFAAASVAQAQGQRERVVEREAQREQNQQQQASQQAEAQAQAQAQRQAQRQQQQQQNQQQQQQRRAVPVQAQPPGQRERVVEREAQRQQQRNSGGYYGNGRPPVVVGSPGYRPGGPNYRNPNYGRVVTRLPPGYRDYRWRGNPYYYAGGSWYSRRGSSYVIVGAPLGLYVNYLPSYYSTVWVGGSRYYYADDTYYTYDTGRRGYVVTRSPYDDGDSEYVGEQDQDGDSSAVEELFIYPTRGQSEQQQSDDKYECHKWANEQTGYDPTRMDYDRSQREQYDRAQTACLTARGYTVK